MILGWYGAGEEGFLHVMVLGLNGTHAMRYQGFMVR